MTAGAVVVGTGDAVVAEGDGAAVGVSDTISAVVGAGKAVSRRSSSALLHAENANATASADMVTFVHVCIGVTLADESERLTSPRAKSQV